MHVPKHKLLPKLGSQRTFLYLYCFLHDNISKHQFMFFRYFLEYLSAVNWNSSKSPTSMKNTVNLWCYCRLAHNICGVLSNSNAWLIQHHSTSFNTSHISPSSLATVPVSQSHIGIWLRLTRLRLGSLHQKTDPITPINNTNGPPRGRACNVPTGREKEVEAWTPTLLEQQTEWTWLGNPKALHCSCSVFHLSGTPSLLWLEDMGIQRSQN